MLLQPGISLVLMEHHHDVGKRSTIMPGECVTLGGNKTRHSYPSTLVELATSCFYEKAAFIIFLRWILKKRTGFMTRVPSDALQ